MKGEDGKSKSCYVSGHVGCVCLNRYGTGENATDNLGDHEEDTHDEHSDEFAKDDTVLLLVVRRIIFGQMTMVGATRA